LDTPSEVCQRESVAGVARFTRGYIKDIVCYVPGLGLASVGPDKGGQRG